MVPRQLCRLLVFAYAALYALNVHALPPVQTYGKAVSLFRLNKPSNGTDTQAWTNTVELGATSYVWQPWFGTWRASSVGEASVAQSMATSGMYHDIVMDSLRVVAQDAPLAQRLASADPSAAPVAPAWEQPIDIRLCGGPPTQVDALAGAFVRLGDTGTATVISPDGFALTSARLVEGLRSTEVTRAGGSVASARVVRVDEVADVALLAVEGAEQACVPPTRDKAKVGDPAISVIAADEGIATAAGGLTSEGESSGLRMFEVSAAAYAIGPGGAVLDDQRRRLGVRVRPVDSAEYGVLPSALVPGRLGIQGAAASTSDLDAVQRIAKTDGEPLGPVATEEPALVPPRAPGRTSTVITDVPGALEMSAGGTMLAVGGSVALITGGLWAQEASNPWTLTNNGPTYAAITITGAAVAAGGGALLAVGWRKQQAAQQAELTLGPSHIGVRGRF